MDAASGQASLNLNAGSHAVTSSVAATSYGGDGAVAELVSSITASSSSGLGGPQALAVNALLGFPMPMGTSAFLLCRHVGRPVAVA